MGQYIRVPLDIETRHETLRLARLLSIPVSEAVCALIRFMVWGDLNADEERVACIDPDDLDAITRQPGFSRAAQNMGLIRFVDGGVDPAIQVLTDLVDEQTFAVRRKELEADRERKRLAKQFRQNSAGIPSEFRRGEESRAKQRNLSK